MKMTNDDKDELGVILNGINLFRLNNEEIGEEHMAIFNQLDDLCEKLKFDEDTQIAVCDSFNDLIGYHHCARNRNEDFNKELEKFLNYFGAKVKITIVAK